MLQLQPGAALAPALSLADLDPALTDVVFSALSFADKIRVLQVCMAFKQALTQPRPRLLRVAGDGETEELHLDLHRSVSVGRGYLVSDAFPREPIWLLKYVSRVACRVRVVSTAPAELEISVPPMSTMNGILVDADGDGLPTWHMLSGTVRLPALARFALDVQNAPISTFQFVSLPPHLVPAPLLPSLHPMLATTQPSEDMALDEPEPPESEPPEAHWLTRDLMHHIATFAIPSTLLALKAVSRDYHAALKPARDPTGIWNTLVKRAVLRWGCSAYGNDPDDLKGLSVLLAAHSTSKTHLIVKKAFPMLEPGDVNEFVSMPHGDVFAIKKGGGKWDAGGDAQIAVDDIIQTILEEEGDAVWFSGGGGDRIVQSSSLTDFVNTRNIRPLTFRLRPADWEDLGVRPSPNPSVDQWGRKSSVNLSSSSDGTGTYRAELWRRGQAGEEDTFVKAFMIGVFPHPGSLSWGAVDSSAGEAMAVKFLRDLASATPAQANVVKFYIN